LLAVRPPNSQASNHAPRERLSAVDSIERSSRALKLIRASFIRTRLAPWRDVRALVDAPAFPNSSFAARCEVHWAMLSAMLLSQFCNTRGVPRKEPHFSLHIDENSAQSPKYRGWRIERFKTNLF
jgi:hypothetical protein